jgi:cytochrome c oxidase cbb3-type subunit 4
MDVNTLRAVLTAACFVIFVGIVLWAYGGARRERFAEAARLPLEEDASLEPRSRHGGGADGHSSFDRVAAQSLSRALSKDSGRTEAAR